MSDFEDKAKIILESCRWWDKQASIYLERYRKNPSEENKRQLLNLVGKARIEDKNLCDLASELGENLDDPENWEPTDET